MDPAERWLVFTVAMIVLAFGLSLIPLLALAEAFPHLTCPVVRSLVAEHGEAKAIDLAAKHGATREQIREMRKCLK